MRAFGPLVRLLRSLVAFAASVVLVTSIAPFVHLQAADAAAVLAAARDAMGGDKRIEAVRTFIANGRTRQIRGDNLVPIEFEIQVELPDKYSRRDEFPAQDAGPVTAGFNGDRLIQIPPASPPVARAGGPPAPTPAQQEAAMRARVATAKQDFARLMLGLFGSSYASFPLTFDYVAQAEAPEGKADVLDVKGPANFTARLFVNAQTHLPIMLSWRVQAPPARGGGPGGPGGPGQGTARGGPPATPSARADGGGPPPGAPAAPGTTSTPSTPSTTPTPAPVENRMYFADYRDVDGLKLPFRIRRAAGSETTEETIFDRFRINARTDARRFEVGN
jgi:hypothetical protein